MMNVWWMFTWAGCMVLVLPYQSCTLPSPLLCSRAALARLPFFRMCQHGDVTRQSWARQSAKDAVSRCSPLPPSMTHDPCSLHSLRYLFFFFFFSLSLRLRAGTRTSYSIQLRSPASPSAIIAHGFNGVSCCTLPPVRAIDNPANLSGCGKVDCSLLTQHARTHTSTYDNPDGPDEPGR